jgi:hypothetical protein
MAAFVSPADAQEMSCYLARGSMEEAAQRPSPLGQAVIGMDGQEALFCYGRPSAKGRVVMGELVPFGQAWRMGANEAAALHLPFAAEVGGVDLEAGSYSIYAVPGEEEWTFTLNSNVERWGIPINEEVKATDVGSFTRSVNTTEEMVEQFTVTWKAHGEGMGHLVIQWENTSVEIPIHGPGM